MLDNYFRNGWFGSDISCCNPCIVVINESMSVPSGRVMSTGHHDLDLISSLMANLVDLQIHFLLKK